MGTPFKMKGWSPFTQKNPAGPAGGAISKKKTDRDEHDIEAEKLNTTRQWCAVCGAHKSEHQNKDHPFKVQKPAGPDTKPHFLERKPTGPRE